MFYRLINIDNPSLTFGLTSSTWFGILEMAEENGWNPMGTIPSEFEDASFVLAGMGLFERS